MTFKELKSFLDQKHEEYNHPDFIQTDPIQLVHRFTKKEDQEIVALLISTIAWGNRTMIIRSGEKLIQIMGNDPHEFILNYEPDDTLEFVHRTFNKTDLDFFFRGLKNIYQNGGLESSFMSHSEYPGAMGRIYNFREMMKQVDFEERSLKHISDPTRNSASKRLNMFLRWMVRDDQRGVDLGIWKSIPSSELMLPLDVHTGNIVRALGMTSRKQNDWKALEEVMQVLRKCDPNDPVKYDFALFGLGAFEDFL